MESWRDLTEWGSEVLADAGVGEGPDARYIAEFASGQNYREIVGSHAAQPTPDEIANFRRMIGERAERIPLQHVLGTMWFRYLELASRPGAFIVRPETEQVTQAAIDELTHRAAAARSNIVASGRPTGAPPIVIDLCTGSGAIALAIATELPHTNVYAVELSDDAYATASENNQRYGSPVTLVHGDARTSLDELLGRATVVVTNPPYVPPYHELSPEVRQDPALALFGGGDDGLELPRQLVTRSHELLADSGILVMEHAEEQSEALREAALETGFTSAQTGKDLAGRERYLLARKGGNDGGH